jgi:hypothetical protein
MRKVQSDPKPSPRLDPQRPRAVQEKSDKTFFLLCREVASERRVSSELERKSQFKEAFYEIRFAIFIFVWNFNKSSIQSL